MVINYFYNTNIEQVLTGQGVQKRQLKGVFASMTYILSGVNKWWNFSRIALKIQVNPLAIAHLNY